MVSGCKNEEAATAVTAAEPRTGSGTGPVPAVAEPASTPRSRRQPTDRSTAIPDVPCEALAIKAQRKAADMLVKAGKASDASALLESGSCFLSEDMDPALQAQIAWRINDQSFG